MIAFAAANSAATETAQRLTGRGYLSWSAISTYLRCPLKYQYHYLDQLPEEFVAANLVFGAAIHAALEAYFREQLTFQRALGMEALLAVYQDTWRQTPLEEVQFGKQDDLASLARLAERMLQAVLASDLARPAGAILGIEEELQGPVIADCPDLLARLDLVVETETALVVTDFKTARSRWSAADLPASEGQLLLYHELVHDWTDKPVRLQFAVLTKTKQPEVDLQFIAPDPQRIARFRRLIQHVWQGIQAGNFYPVPSALNCPTCGYRDRCARWPA